jgi:hypothetical protein
MITWRWLAGVLPVLPVLAVVTIPLSDASIG